MTKIRPGARFGMAVPIAGEVRCIPLRNKHWKTSLHNKGQENRIVFYFRKLKNQNTERKIQN